MRREPPPAAPATPPAAVLMLRVFLLGVCLLVVCLLGACSAVISGRAQSGDGVVTAPVDTSIVQGSDGGPIDTLAAATLLDVQSYWAATFEPTFDRPWRDLQGGFFSVDTSDPHAPPPPCLDTSVQLEGNAFYCADADAVAWDRTALFPVLREQYGDGGVVVVLAHEIGHAVHHRLGIDRDRARHAQDRYPTILTEAMADCYAGSFVRWVAEGHAEHLRLDPRELDRALGALVTFRDPVGTSAGDTAAHGNAFDRVSAFQDGYQQGPGLCGDFTVANRNFTQEQFTSYSDLAMGGNLPFERIVGLVIPDLDRYFAELVTARGGNWHSPDLRAGAPAPACSTGQGPAAFCPDRDTIALDTTGVLPRLHAEIGDYATGTLLASRYSLAALDALGRPTEGASARRATLCLTGAYTRALLQRNDGFGLSPGDLDEAVQVLLGYDYASRDESGQGLPSGFARVGDFRAGTLEGVEACGLP